MITLSISGDKELAAAFNRLADPKRQRAIVRSGLARGMTIMVKTTKALIPPATTPKHSTKSIQRSIDRSFKKDAITHIVGAKVGVNVGRRPLKTVRGIPLQTQKGKQQTPHAHLYIAGTELRWSGFKEHGRSSRVTKTNLTPSGRIRIKRRGEVRRTKNPIRFHGRVMPKDYIAQGVNRSWPLAMAVVRDAVWRGIEDEMKKSDSVRI